MRLLHAGSLSLALAAACGGSSSSEPPIGPSACDPLAQTGCGASQRCGVIVVDGGATDTGCVPVGTASAGEACTFGSEGPTTGYDTCGAGLACVSGTCRSICPTSGDASACGTTRTCVAYAGVFDGLGAGVCDPTCDPVTQVRLTDGAAACGSPDPGNPSLGCYGFPRSNAPTVFTCVNVPAGVGGHRTEPLGPAGGGAFLNGCAPGYLPLLARSSTDPSPVCIALCSPVESSLGSAAQRQGASPHSCPDAGATGTGEECRFWWWLEDGSSPNQWSNTIGFCMDHTLYTWDHDRDGVTPEVQTPSCSDLPTTDDDGDGVPDHRFWGCAPAP